MKSASAEHLHIFDANRAAGRIAFSVAAMEGKTRRRDVSEQGPLRVRFPNAEGGTLEAIVVNTAGGIAGGDRLALDISVGEGARLVAGTAAAEKVYRSHGPEARLSLRIEVKTGARFCWLPQETIVFDRSRLFRTIDVNLAPEATAVIAEAVVFGRSAMGELVNDGALTDHWRVRVGGRLAFAESTRLSGNVAARLALPAVAKGGCAIATVLIAPGDEASIERVRACTGLAGAIGISAWNGIAVARLCAADGAALRNDLINVLTALSIPLPRLWLQ
jgi:urease accessory protein